MTALCRECIMLLLVMPALAYCHSVDSQSHDGQAAMSVRWQLQLWFDFDSTSFDGYSTAYQWSLRSHNIHWPQGAVMPPYLFI